MAAGFVVMCLRGGTVDEWDWQVLLCGTALATALDAERLELCR